MSGSKAGVRARFTDQTAARNASRQLEHAGVPAERILLDANAPGQSPAPSGTAERDTQTERRSFRGGMTGLAIGAAIGAVAGAVVGALLNEVFSMAWYAFVLAGALFVMGIGLLWGMLLRTPEGRHYGTVVDAPGEGTGVSLTVTLAEDDSAQAVRSLLREVGGTHLEDAEVADLEPEH